MPATFDDFGIRFLYPDNWAVAGRSMDSGIQGVTFELPGGGFLSIEQSDKTISEDEILDEVAKTVAKEYEEVERESIELNNAGPNDRAIELRFYYLDLLIQSRIVLMNAGGQRLLVQIQAENRDFDSNELVFEAIFTQLRAL
jgi:hypothetical protein